MDSRIFTASANRANIRGDGNFLKNKLQTDTEMKSLEKSKLTESFIPNVIPNLSIPELGMVM